MESHNVIGPLGYRYGDDHGMWNVFIYPTPVELVGGVNDGTIALPGFNLDLQELMSAFDQVIDLSWCSQSYGPFDLDAPHISIEGVYA